MPAPVRHCAFLTMSDPGDFVIDAHLGIAPLEALGWTVGMQPWREPADWDGYDAVYIGTPWDYPGHAAAFMDVLRAIDRSAALLVNPLELVTWNLDKRYLRELERGGAPIVPTLWRESFDPGETDGWFESHGADAIVVKPRVGANAADTFVLRQPPADTVIQSLEEIFHRRPFLVQPFIENVMSEGEYSLFFLAGEFSHAIVKQPKRGDFRVQEEHGAAITAVDPPATLLAAANEALQLVRPAPVYARADFLRKESTDDDWLLMELELIEPSLYLRMDADAPARFARAFDQYARSATV